MKDPISVLLLTNRYPSPEKPYAGWYVKAHQEYHERLGYQVKMLTYFHGVHHRSWLGSTVFFLLGVLRAIVSPIDVIHGHWIFPSGLLAVIIGEVRGIPVVVTSHGAYIQEFDKQNRLVQSLIQLTLARASAIVAVGRGHARLLGKIAPGCVDKTHIVDMGVVMPDAEVSISDARIALGLPQDEQIIMYVGNLIANKGPDLFVQAARLISEALGTCKFLVIGQGPLKADLEMLAADLGLTDQIRFLGPVAHDEVNNWLFAADLLVVPSRREPFGLIAIEAMACAKPIVAADVGELSSNIRDGVNGLLFPAGDSHGLSTAVLTVLRDDTLRARLAIEGKRFAQQFDYRLKTEEIAAIYQDLALHK